MLSENMYMKGTMVWIPHADDVWEIAKIRNVFEGIDPLIMEIIATNHVIFLMIHSKTDLPPIYIPEDDLYDEKVNLVSLRFLHEASVLNAIRKRFERRCVYNYCGVVTVFLNPFSDLYIGENIQINNYRENPINNLKPHIFAVCKKVYTRLERDNCDQSLIFTGESGAGKTENVKKAILYLVTTGTTDSVIKNKILASLTVLQAFGNAKTIKNDNSSRFGNYIEIQYDNNYELIGAILKTYLLDRSRVVSQDYNEQNFHIFYQLHAARYRFPHLQLHELHELGFYYVDETNLIRSHDENYLAHFKKTLVAMNTLGFSLKFLDEMWKILAAIIFIRKIEFKKHLIANAESCFIDNMNHLEILTKLLGVSLKTLNVIRKWLCYKKIFAQRHEILEPMTLSQAQKSRDALAKFLYTKLFHWIVVQINASFRSPCNVQSFIGILDFYGFEKFSVNSFEQFCINYTAEKIQQYYIQSIFKLEQEEYLREDIGWIFMRFQDNRRRLELLEEKDGIIDIINEETKISMASQHLNTAWVANLLITCQKSEHFERPESCSVDFIIHHFIDNVRYDPSEFSEKNRDTASRELLGVLKESKNELLIKLVLDEYTKMSQRSQRKSSTNKRISQYTKPPKNTLVSELRYSLEMLRMKLCITTPHFVRCIKTNHEKQPSTLDLPLINQQLRVFNVLETIQISKNGYFCQQLYKKFASRYYCLCSNSIKRDNTKESCRLIVNANVENIEEVKFGQTKIFLREDTILHLEKLREEKRLNAAIVIQKTFRRYRQKKRYEKVQNAVLCIQRYVRKFLVYKRKRVIIEDQAARKIQAYVRKWLKDRKLDNQRREMQMQLQMQMISAATEIQRLVRGFMARRECKRRLHDIVVIQSCIRRFLAKIAVNKLRKSRNEHMKLLNKEQETNIDLLQKNKLIDYLIERHLPSKELEAMQITTDSQECLQTKNKILNNLLFQQIETLKKLRRKKINSLKVPKIEDIKPEEYEDKRKTIISHPVNTLNQPLPEDHSKLYQQLFQTYREFDQRAECLRISLGLDNSEVTCLRASIRASRENNRNRDKETLEGEDYKGMFQFNVEEQTIDTIVNRLIIDSNPLLLAIQETPWIPVQILFMCIRYIDSLNNRQAACYLLKSYIQATTNIIKQKNDFKVIVLWLSNTHQLLNYLKQYSNYDENKVEDQFHTENTHRQNEQCLQNLDLSDQWEELTKTAQWIMKIAMKKMKSCTAELMKPALLNNENVDKLDVNILSYEENMDFPKKLYVQLLTEINHFHELLISQIHREPLMHMFKQLFEFLNTMILSNIMTKRELCTSLKGIQIRCMLRYIEQWATNNYLTPAISAFNPVKQACRFLLIQPIDECSVDWIVKHYTELNTNQVMRMIDSYIQTTDSENPISQNTIDKLRSKLTEREELENTIILDAKNSIEFPFHYSSACLEEVEIPEEFNLPMLEKI